MFVLSATERIAILSGCIGLLITVILLTICFVCPVCWFHRLVNRRKPKEDAEMNYFNNYFLGSNLDHEPPPPYEVSNKTAFFDLKSPLEFGRRLTAMNSISTISSDADSVTGIPLPLLRDTEVPEPEIQESSSFELGNVSITLQFKRIFTEDNEKFSQLRVDMKEATKIPLRSYGGKCDIYFKISLYDKNINKKKRNKLGIKPLYEFNSTLVKKTQHPMFNECFFFPLLPNRLKKSMLKIEIWDQDKFANDTHLGEVLYSLKDVAAFLLEEPSQELDLNLKLEHSKTVNGQLLIGLCYLPTAERLTVTVLKADKLRAFEENNHVCDYYIQAMAILGGKVCERRKTSSRAASQSPVFNEMLMFDVPFEKLDRIVLLLAVRCSCVTVSSENQPNTSKDAFIGKVFIRYNSIKNSQNHWNDMINSPRRQVIKWHQLT